MIKSKYKDNQKHGNISAIMGSLIKIKGLEKDVRLHDLIKV